MAQPDCTTTDHNLKVSSKHLGETCETLRKQGFKL